MNRQLLIIVSSLATLALATPALGESGSALFERPLGAVGLEALQPISFGRDQRGNRVQVRGRGFQAEALAAGNVISVVAQGSGNTITINADQVNSGSQTATVALNGQLNLN